VLQYVAVCREVWCRPFASPRINRVAVSCSELQCVAACCSVLQCVAVSRQVGCRPFASPTINRVAVISSVLQCLAVGHTYGPVWGGFG